MPYIPFSVSSAGNNTLVAGVSGETIIITAIFLQCGAATSIKLRSNNTDLTGAMNFAVGGGLNIPYVGLSLFECAQGDALNLHIGGLGGSCAGGVLYTQM